MNSVNEPSDLPSVEGLMFIGDPHLEARVPGFRKDDFPNVALGKLRWCLRHARQERLQPLLLGDLFQLPQDNPNWLLAEIMQLWDQPLPAIYGNHDVRENVLKPNDSLSVLVSGGKIRLLSADQPWIGQVGGRLVVVGGSSWGQSLPLEGLPTAGSPTDEQTPALAVWLTHHDLLIPGYEEAGRIRPRELPAIDLVVNGHIHRRLETVSRGSTHWMTPGNITRRTRSDASRRRRPSVLCLRPGSADLEVSIPTEPAADGLPDRFDFRSRQGEDWIAHWVVVPHRPFDDVFHPESEVPDEEEEAGGSGFVADLRELTARRTDTGAGLVDYLQHHLGRFSPPVASEITRLAEEVLGEPLASPASPGAAENGTPPA